MRSLPSFFANLRSKNTLKAFRARLSPAHALALGCRWSVYARVEQQVPGGDWTTWLYLGGRGAGKTRAGAEWIHARVARGEARRIALVGATAADVRDVMVEGESGLMATARPWAKPEFEPSKRRLTWPNGAIATLFSAEEPDALRGPQHDTAWCDELCKWSYPQNAWDNLQLGLRLGARPQQMVSTTPRAMALLKTIMARSDTKVSRGSTYDNRDNLAPAFFAEVIRRYEHTRFGRQELLAEILEDLPGALWTRTMLDAALVGPLDVPKLVRVVVGVDPSGTRGDDGRDAVGIVAVGKDANNVAYVLDDWTCSLSPAKWADRVVHAWRRFGADRVVVEQNFGGAMVEHTIRAADPSVPITNVNASRGKIARAEPIAALYEQGRVKHVGTLTELEEQLVGFTREGYAGQRSPDRADAAIWALTELMLSAPVKNEDGWLQYAAEKVEEWRAKGMLPEQRPKRREDCWK
jgi:phage terminase large subunit-like protein